MFKRRQNEEEGTTAPPAPGAGNGAKMKTERYRLNGPPSLSLLHAARITISKVQWRVLHPRLRWQVAMTDGRLLL